MAAALGIWRGWALDGSARVAGHSRSFQARPAPQIALARCPFKQHVSLGLVAQTTSARAFTPSMRLMQLHDAAARDLWSALLLTPFCLP